MNHLVKNLFKRGCQRGIASHDDIEARGEAFGQPIGFLQPSPNTISKNGLSNLFTDEHAQTIVAGILAKKDKGGGDNLYAGRVDNALDFTTGEWDRLQSR